MTHAADRFDQLKEDERFSKLVERLEGHLKGPLARYRERATPIDTGGPPNAKALKDGVWGMIDVSAQEVALIDSPPFQRLRRVRQLGVGYLTYPTAGYSRFEHSLGAVHQCERMLRAIASRSREEVGDKILKQRHVLRLAALLHDIGHLPMSHVSERYFADEECVNRTHIDEALDVTLAVKEVLGAPSPYLAECLSLAVIRTDSFYDLLVSHAGYSADDIATAAHAIVGSPAGPETAFIPQLITNIVDADKLDYMFRDAWATRVPLAVDLERMLYKLKCLAVAPSELPESLGKYTGKPTDPVLVLATDQSGNRLVYDLTVGRTMLFERVYLHHKTRAAERVALRALGQLDMHFGDLVTFGDEVLGPLGHAIYTDARRPIEMLIDRDLPRRSFAMSYAFLAQGERAPGEKEQTMFEDVARELRTLERRSKIEDAVFQRATVLAGIYPGANQAPTAVWLDTKPATPAIGKNDFLVEHPDGHIDNEGTNFAPEGSAATHSPEELVFFFSSGPRKSDLVVHVASELEVHDHFGLYFGRASADRAKIDRREVDDVKRGLERRRPEIFDDVGLLRPPARYIREGEGPERLTALANTWQQYNHGGARVDPDHITRFVDQFPEALVRPLLDVLDELVFLTRDDLGARLKQATEQLVNEGAVLVPLTRERGGSATHLSYYVAKAGAPEPVSLEDALQLEGDIVFIDDCLVSGFQSTGVVHTLMAGKKDTPKARVLTEPERKLLSARKLHFVFAYTAEHGRARLQQGLDDFGLTGEIHPAGSFREDNYLAPARNQEDALREFLRKVGRGLLLSSEDEAEHKKAETHALGWGNDEQLVVSIFGVPKGTVTALWHAGSFRGIPWHPLFPVVAGGEPPALAAARAEQKSSS